MTQPVPPIDEDEIQGFVDGRLTPDRQAAVAAWLAADPVQGTRVRALRLQRDALREALWFKAAEPVPDRLRLAAQRLPPRRRWPAMAAAASVALLLGAGGGWLARGTLEGGPRVAGTEAAWGVRTALAANAHRVYVADAFRPVEIYATAGDLVIRWLTNRLGRPVEAPELSGVGLRFLGGRLIPTLEGPAGQLMYEDAAGGRVTLFMVPATAGGRAPVRLAEVAGIGTASFADARFLYTVVAAASPERLNELAEAVRAALPGGAGAPRTRS